MDIKFMKKKYIHPQTVAHTIEVNGMICVSNVTSVTGSDFIYGGGGDGTGTTAPRARFFDGLMEEETTPQTSTLNDKEEWEEEEGF